MSTVVTPALPPHGIMSSRLFYGSLLPGTILCGAQHSQIAAVLHGQKGDLASCTRSMCAPVLPVECGEGQQDGQKEMKGNKKTIIRSGSE